MFRQQASIISSSLNRQIRLKSHQVPKFPKLENITVKDLGFGSEINTLGFSKTYNLQRTKFNKLPIYTEYKGGNVPYTELRKIHGDIIQLRNDLQAALPEAKLDDFKVIMESKKILIKGNYKKKLNSILSHSF
ncbi:54S ribosomal protein IMG2, mitochondrial [Wickerhamomyces ciferrii]|uniref:Large ribosomal subunit protein mL49 n=1 Tax=Wickerhamomyces ciferrii (strain ATCC 14091 / BCRC 22168 / CBS 111 / JCM 3599 / NBRC 0793 / NRRL Y-1031 F-60-10) TaxID=1206466 RepID=K0KPD8_WICCF|nr:54S ribosomal protein IMG2, mitochondrial [Wickerhamomyces ciferrii]CCH44816.1 54S ribosomal protein IMG2, mitochondrial [Wickerhamomyces ciferrii]